MAKKNVTFADIAAYTGFSKTTISRYFNNPDSITVENQEKIANALEILNYKENKLARVMANGKTEMVGVIIPNLYMHYYSDMLNHIISTYEKYGYKFIVFAGNEDAEVERQYIQELLAYKTEGLIILSHTLSSKELSEYHIPIVTIEREDEYVCSVNTDNYMGGMQAATILAKSGCDILIHANADFPSNIPAYGRIQGFQDFCKANGFKHRILIRDFGDSFEENNVEIAKLLQEIEEAYSEKKVWFYAKYVTDEPVNHQEGVNSGSTLGFYDMDGNCLGYAQERVDANWDNAYIVYFLDPDFTPTGLYASEDCKTLWDDSETVLAEGDIDWSYSSDMCTITITPTGGKDVPIFAKIAMYVKLYYEANMLKM